MLWRNHPATWPIYCTQFTAVGHIHFFPTGIRRQTADRYMIFGCVWSGTQEQFEVPMIRLDWLV